MVLTKMAGLSLGDLGQMLADKFGVDALGAILALGKLSGLDAVLKSLGISAQGGMHTTLARDTLIRAHAGERVDIGRGGGTTINQYLTINALDGESVRRLIPTIMYELQLEQSRSR